VGRGKASADYNNRLPANGKNELLPAAPAFSLQKVKQAIASPPQSLANLKSDQRNLVKIPQRLSLLNQTTDILRTAIADGTWSGYLPGERVLSRRLHVSRPTLRAALDILERERVLETTPGKRRRIMRQRKSPLKKGGATVVLVTQSPLYTMSRNRLFLFDHLHHALEENDIRLEVVSNAAFGSGRPWNSLKQFADTSKVRCYVLARTSRQVQEWFAEKALPCLIVGSSFPGINIPSIESDYPAIGRHAAGTLLGKGHRKLLFLTPQTNLAGDLETESAFTEAVSLSKHADAQCEVIRFDHSSDGLVRRWEKLVKSGRRPTAAFSLYPTAALAMMTHLLRGGVRVPEDFSLICREYTPLLEWVRPAIGHYEVPLSNFAHRLSSLVFEMVEVGTLPLRHITILPELSHTESLSDAPR